MDMSKPWCIYRTSHPSGHFYQALTWVGHELSTWTTTVLDTFDTEEDAYLAEEALVTHESLANPFCMNMMQGGRRGKYKTPSSLLRRYRMAIKRERAAVAKTKRKEKEAAARKIAAEKLKAAKAALAARSALRSSPSTRSTGT